MVIYSGFSTRRQQQRYNHLTKELLRLLNQIIITYVESSKLSVFKPTYEKLILQIGKMDQHKYSDLKVSMEVDLLTQHILNQDQMMDYFTDNRRIKAENKHHFRMKRNERNIESANSKTRQRRTLSLSHDKKLSRHTISETQSIREPTMQQLMKIHPLIERKMTHIRKKKYVQPQPNNFVSNNFPQIQQEEQQIDEHQ